MAWITDTELLKEYAIGCGYRPLNGCKCTQYVAIVIMRDKDNIEDAQALVKSYDENKHPYRFRVGLSTYWTPNNWGENWNWVKNKITRWHPWDDDLFAEFMEGRK